MSKKTKEKILNTDALFTMIGNFFGKNAESRVLKVCSEKVEDDRISGFRKAKRKEKKEGNDIFIILKSGEEIGCNIKSNWNATRDHSRVHPTIYPILVNENTTDEHITKRFLSILEKQ